jgi:hypothetical protein
VTSCLFCQNPNADVTVEDALSNPIGALLKTGRVSFFHWSVDDKGVSRREPYEAERVTYKRRAYCADCNNKWMQLMDLNILPLLTPMIEGKQVELSTADQFTIATWATKIALVYESLEGPLVPPGVYRWFYDNRMPLVNQPIQLARYVDAQPHTYIRKAFAVKNGMTLEVDYFESVILGVVIGQYLAINVLNRDGFPVD